MHIRVLDWYHLYPNHRGGSRLKKTTQEVCFLKVLVTQAELFTNTFKTCQQFKTEKIIMDICHLRILQN